MMTRNSNIFEQHKKGYKWTLEGAKNDLQRILDGYESELDFYNYKEMLNYVFNIIDTLVAETREEDVWFYKQFSKEDTDYGKH